MQTKLAFLYGHPTKPAAFEKYYAKVHLPLAGKMTGFHPAELSKGLPGPDGSNPALPDGQILVRIGGSPAGLF